MRPRAGEVVALGVVRIPLSKGYFALIDEADLPAIGQFNWCVRTATKDSPYIYAMRWRRSDEDSPNNILMHRQIMGVSSDLKVDHRDGNTLDNRRSNLRICTRGQNKQNTRSVSARTGFKGVQVHGKSWSASLNFSKKTYYLGVYDTPEKAARAYDAAAVTHFGEFAATNEALGRFSASTTV